MKSAIVAIGLLAVASGVCPDAVADAQEPVVENPREALRERAEGVLREALAKARKAGEEFSVWRLRKWPFKLAEPELLRALRSGSSDVRLEAAERLVEETGKKHKKKIEQALRDLKPEDDTIRARWAVLRLRLGDSEALREVREWALLDFKRERTIPVWWCPMHPPVQKSKEDECPICKMSLVKMHKMQGKFDYPRRQAQLTALKALADRKDKSVPVFALYILTDDAEPHWRMHAAYQWARVAPDQGQAHFRIFLTSPRLQTEALSLAKGDLAERFVREFEAVLDDSDHPQYNYSQIDALDGLLATGKREHLDAIRPLVESADPKDERFEWLAAMDVLAKYGTEEDVERLAPLLDGPFAERAATAILRIMGRVHPR